MNFPEVRLRRLRRSEAARALLRETRLQREDFVLPLFVAEGSGVCEPIPSLPGVARFSADRVLDECKRAAQLGIPGVLLFGVPAHKDARGSAARAADGAVQRATAAIKQSVPELLVMTDVCLCAYTDHGHCGLVAGDEVLNDPTLDELAAVALSHARAGADVVAPSDMMDGRVRAIRAALDAHDFSQVAILSYAAKLASAWYGPFRDASNSAPAFGDRRTYQLDPPNRREALRELQQDLAEGADMLMVKPALSTLDVLAHARQRFDAPLAAYLVSGEYAMLKLAAEHGVVDGARALWEVHLAIKRAGADFILSYAAKEMASALR